MAANEPDYMRLLTESLEILASNPQAQIASIDRPGLGADDLAEDHIAPTSNAEWMCEEGLISFEVRRRVECIDAIFTEMTSQHNEDRWTCEALVADPPDGAKYESSPARHSNYFMPRTRHSSRIGIGRVMQSST